MPRTHREKQPLSSYGKHGLVDSGPRWRMGPIKFAGATRMLRQAGEQQRQLINAE